MRIFLGVLILLVIVLIAATIVVRREYDQNLRPLSNSQQSRIIIINSGSSVNQIADLLHQDNLIRASWALEWYVRASSSNIELEAGTYDLSPSQSVGQIVSILSQGKVATKLVTILPGKRLDQINAILINAGFAPSAVTAALQPAQYQDLPALAYKPAGADLEGLLYPDSFQKTASTDPSVIVRESLVEMGQHLTPGLQTAFAKEGLSTYQGIILASIVEQEVSTPSDQAQAAQVFLKRLSLNMPLGSDVTAYYGAILNGQVPSTTYDSPFNTLIHTGLPPTPISNVNDQALNAVAHPANTDWLYFVTGDNSTTYFSQTAAQQQANVAEYCHALCSQDGP
jgi:UPF0755 protein